MNAMMLPLSSAIITAVLRLGTLEVTTTTADSEQSRPLPASMSGCMAAISGRVDRLKKDYILIKDYQFITLA